MNTLIIQKPDKKVTLVRDANPIFLWHEAFLLTERKGGLSVGVKTLHYELLLKLKHFESEQRQVGTSALLVRSAVYVLASFCDEAVMNLDRDLAEDWQHSTLLSVLFQETIGGEGVFRIRDFCLQQLPEMLPVLELIYLCISFGFKGRYALEINATVSLKRIQQENYYCLSRYQGESLKLEQDLSRQISEKKSTKEPLTIGGVKKHLLWHVKPILLVGAVFLLMLYLTFSVLLSTHNKEVAEALYLPVGSGLSV